MSIFLMMMAVFLVFVFLGIPVSFSIGLSTVAAVLAKGMPLAFVSQMAFTGLDSYTYLAIPMFILAGYLMETGGLSKRLVNFAASLVGNIHGYTIRCFPSVSPALPSNSLSIRKP